MSTPTKSYFCPECGGADIATIALVGSNATCLTCRWTGMNSDLVTHVFSHDLGTDEDILRTITAEYKLIIGRHMATPLAALLNKWGFFIGPPTPQQLTRYLVAMGKASLNAMFEVRKDIEKERVNAGN